MCRGFRDKRRRVWIAFLSQPRGTTGSSSHQCALTLSLTIRFLLQAVAYRLRFFFFFFNFFLDGAAGNDGISSSSPPANPAMSGMPVIFLNILLLIPPPPNIPELEIGRASCRERV